MDELTGYILDFEEAASRLSPDVGQDYVSYEHIKFSDPFMRSADRAKLKGRRDAFAAPIEIGSFAESQEIGVSHDAFVKKPSSSFKIYIPHNEAYAVSVAAVIAQDLLKLYGTEAFKRANLFLLNKHSVVSTLEAQMKDKGFDIWHDHVSNTHHPVDILYTFHTVLPTEIKSGESVVAPRNNVICRLGGEVLHRSRKNYGQPVARQFGTILVEREENYAYRKLPTNSAFNQSEEALLPVFKNAADKVLAGAYRSCAYDVPVPVSEINIELHV